MFNQVIPGRASREPGIQRKGTSRLDSGFAAGMTVALTDSTVPLNGETQAGPKATPAHSTMAAPAKTYPCGAPFARVQSWPPQNNPPKAQPSTRSTSGLFRAILEA
jgi:hypothetical protein